jgi:hypothetical protein
MLIFSFKKKFRTFITTRADHFDTDLVESGPPPLKLADGNYLFFYNSATYMKSEKPGYNL